MNKKMHFKMLALGLFGLFLTFRREIHDYARIEDQNDKEEEELRALNSKYESRRESLKSIPSQLIIHNISYLHTFKPLSLYPSHKQTFNLQDNQRLNLFFFIYTQSTQISNQDQNKSKEQRYYVLFDEQEQQQQFIDIKQQAEMGDNLSCCNPTLSQDIDKILYQNEQLLLQQKVDPLSYFIAPNSHLLALLQKGERYLRSKGMLMDIKEDKIEWKQVKNQSKQTKYIFAQGANLNASINQDVIIYFLNGEIFKGHVKDNKPEYGVFVYSSSSFYAGQINNLNAEGEGIFQNQDSGYNYEGKWSKSMPHGYGKESYANGDHYEGQILYGAKFGQGKYTFADGKIYNGQFYYNKSDGKGSIVYKNGNKYEGDWKLGQFYGHGKFQWTNGQSYQGQYVEGKRHGLGKYTFKDGRIYQGDWVNGFQQGNGKLQSKYDQIKGVWQQGQFLHSRQ